MNLMYNFLPIYLLLEVCMSLRNLHLPHDDERYFHHSDQAVQHYNNYQDYDSYSSSSGEVVMRQSPLNSKVRARSHRNIDFSDTDYNYKCKCSCTKCKKRKSKVKPCCQDFCSTECVIQNNILVVPYPVPYMVFNQSATTEYTLPPTTPPTTTTATTTTTTTTTTTEPTTTTEIMTTITTEKTTQSTVPFYQNYIKSKRFHIQNLRRSMGNNDLRSPKMGRLPKYGIVPIPENLALSLMQQIKKDQNDYQLRRRLDLNKNLLDYTRRHIAY